MAIHHAGPGELVDLKDWPHDVDPEQSHTVVKTDYMQLSRIVLPRGKELPEHALPSPIIIQCISGLVELRTERARQSVSAGQLVHLVADDPHSLVAIEDAIVLLTIIER
ncbi:MAG: cupin domain-containing protein [Pseudomonadales bacterium]|nr:cupin domain-containing protein [Pseudomonadales bacterium]